MLLVNFIKAGLVSFYRSKSESSGKEWISIFIQTNEFQVFSGLLVQWVAGKPRGLVNLYCEGFWAGCYPQAIMHQP